jgi:glycosyltransferase involved in cell wall biosynthesis
MNVINKMPLVSIGLPTYNRPAGLKVALEHIISQTYTELEIIISDNHSDNVEEIISIIDHFADSRIKFYHQPVNIGAVNNFKFLVENASGSFFMWTADDDFFDSRDLVEQLVSILLKNSEISLAFPDFTFEEKDGSLHKGVMFNHYSKCVTNNDYISAVIRSGIGHPIYGLFRKDIITNELMLLFYTDLVHFMEGVFVHYIFLNYKVKFIPGIYIRYLTSDVFDKVKKWIVIKDFVKSWVRLLILYQKSTLNFISKIRCLTNLLARHIYTTLKFILK